MKKVIFFILLFVLICFTIPVIFVRGEVMNEPKIEEVNTKEKIINDYDYKQYATIKLLHTETNVIEELSLDEYLYGVVAAEMPANFEIEALKAQAIVARTYTIYNLIKGTKHDNANICDSSNCCQAWISKEKRFEKWNEDERESNWEKIAQAVDSTKGKIITYNKEPINAFFHANSGGTTENVADVWGGSEYEYLQAVATSR